MQFNYERYIIKIILKNNIITFGFDFIIIKILNLSVTDEKKVL